MFDKATVECSLDTGAVYLMSFFLTNLVLFCISGQVPSLEEANKNEGIITLPWAQEKPLELGIFLNWDLPVSLDFNVRYHCSLFSVSMVPCSLGFRVYLNVSLIHKSCERSLG